MWFLKYIVSVFLSFFLFSCSDLLSKAPGVTYQQSVSQLGALPVYPPREDFQVGDIYVVEKKNGLSFEAKKEYLSTENMTKEINEFLSTRYKFNSIKLTSTAAESTNRLGTTWEYIQGKYRELPIAQFPTITVKRGAGASFGSGSLENLTGTLIGGSASASVFMTLTFSGVRSYSAPVADTIQKLNNWCAYQASIGDMKVNCSQSKANQILNFTYARTPGQEGSFEQTNLQMVSKVYLARKISYEYANSQLAALVAKKATADSEENSKTVLTALSESSKGANVSTVTVNIADPKKGITDSDLSSLTDDLKAAIQNEFNKLSYAEGTENTKGFSVSAGNSEFVTFNVEFVRPVAVGYKAVQILAMTDELSKKIRNCANNYIGDYKGRNQCISDQN